MSWLRDPLLLSWLASGTAHVMLVVLGGSFAAPVDSPVSATTRRGEASIRLQAAPASPIIDTTWRHPAPRDDARVEPVLVLQQPRSTQPVALDMPEVDRGAPTTGQLVVTAIELPMSPQSPPAATRHRTPRRRRHPAVQPVVRDGETVVNSSPDAQPESNVRQPRIGYVLPGQGQPVREPARIERDQPELDVSVASSSPLPRAKPLRPLRSSSDRRRAPPAATSVASLPAVGAIDRPLPVALPDNQPPTYPQRAQRAAREGTVLLLLTVDAGGRVADVKLDRSSGSKDLDAAAIEVVRRWRFRPATRGGVPVAVKVLKPFRFRIERQ